MNKPARLPNKRHATLAKRCGHLYQCIDEWLTQANGLRVAAQELLNDIECKGIQDDEALRRSEGLQARLARIKKDAALWMPKYLKLRTDLSEHDLIFDKFMYSLTGSCGSFDTAINAFLSREFYPFPEVLAAIETKFNLLAIAAQCDAEKKAIEEWKRRKSEVDEVDNTATSVEATPPVEHPPVEHPQNWRTRKIDDPIGPYPGEPKDKDYPDSNLERDRFIYWSIKMGRMRDDKTNFTWAGVTAVVLQKWQIGKQQKVESLSKMPRSRVLANLRTTGERVANRYAEWAGLEPLNFKKP